VAARSRARARRQRRRGQDTRGDAALSRLADALAHELHQPLGAILRNAEAARLILASTSPSLSTLRDIVEDIRRDQKRAATMVERVRALVQTPAVDWRLVDVDGLVREALQGPGTASENGNQ
jgi:signal transduction histidine kinase